MPRGRRKARCIGQGDRHPSQESSDDGCPKYKETKLSQTRTHFHKFFTREVETRSPLPLSPLLDCPVAAAAAMDTAEASRDLVCDSPTMPLLTPEVPNGDLSSCLENGMPPKLRDYREEEEDVDHEVELDNTSEKSEGDSGKENDECVGGGGVGGGGVKWRGSRGSLTSRGSKTSLTSLTSRGSRPRSGPFNQLNPINAAVINSTNLQVKESEKKSVLCESMLQQQQTTTTATATATTRTTRTTRLQSRKQLNSSQDDKKQQSLISDKQLTIAAEAVTAAGDNKAAVTVATTQIVSAAMTTTTAAETQAVTAAALTTAAESQAVTAALGHSCTEQLTARSAQLTLKSPSPSGERKVVLVLNTEMGKLVAANQTQESPMSPVKTGSPLTPQSPMSPHKIQILEGRASLAKKFVDVISSPKPFSTKTSHKASTQHRTNSTATKPATTAPAPKTKADKLAQAAEGSRSITEFFPIRRSERKKKSEIEKDWIEGIEARLLATDDTDLDLEVMEIPLKGRGVVARKIYKKGDFVVEYAGELIDIGLAKDRESMYSLDVTKGCYMYYFNHRDKQYCIDATAESGRYGRLINHSCKTPNCVTKVVMLGEEPRLILVAKQDIDEGTELLYDYGDRSKESLKAHPWLAL